MSEAKQKRDGLPEQSVAMRLTEGAVSENPDRYADNLFHAADDDGHGYEPLLHMIAFLKLYAFDGSP